MHLHGQFTAATTMPVYFCDPHAPWQRGSKGTDLNVHTAEHLDTVAVELNDRPRMTLDRDSPPNA